MDFLQKNLITLKKKWARENVQGIALDIDETLCWTIGHLVGEMQKLFGNPENLSIEALIAKYRFTKHVPYWQTPEIKKWLDDYRESSKLKEGLPLMIGAQNAVREINKIIPVVAYITARPEVVADGTKIWLDKHDFPNGEIILRPMHIDHDFGNPWKAQVLHELYPYVLGIVDDNPSLVKHLPKNYLGNILVFGGGVENNSNNIFNCLTWPEVINRVHKLKPLKLH